MLATLVDDPAEKFAVLRALSEHVIPGRWDDVREPSERELQQTTVLSLSLTEASAKVRQGPPLDDQELEILELALGKVIIDCSFG